MRSATLALAGGLILAGGTPVHAGGDPTGFWLTENERSIIEVYDCERGLCGQIVWIIGGGMEYDTANPDESLHDRPLCGLDIMWGFEPGGDDLWDGGEIYKADDGDTYSARLRMISAERMDVRGYVGISLFGSSQTWTRVSIDDFEPCTPPHQG